jgi:putative peptidoglycan lipid II flippase
LPTYLGTSDAAGAFSAAFRIPNFLQNVFGEGALSASFIPVYANLLARGDEKEASRVADAVLTLLALATLGNRLIGILTTPFFVGLFAYSFDPATRELTTPTCSHIFPRRRPAGLIGMVSGSSEQSPAFLFILHRTGGLEPGNYCHADWFGRAEDQVHLASFQFRLATLTAWGSVVGSALQFGVQMPTVLKLISVCGPSSISRPTMFGLYCEISSLFL